MASHKKPTFTCDFGFLKHFLTNTNHEIERSVIVPKATMSHVMCSWSEPKEKSNKKTATTFLLAHYVKTIAHFACPCTICIIFSFFLKCGLVHIHFDFECQIRKKMTLEFSKFALFYLYRFLSFLRAKIDWWPAHWWYKDIDSLSSYFEIVSYLVLSHTAAWAGHWLLGSLSSCMGQIMVRE